MSQVMPLEIGNARQFHERAETAADPLVWLSGPGIEEQILRLLFFSSGNETGNHFVSDFIQRNPAGLASLRFCEKYGPFLKVNLLDLHVESLAAAHPGVACQYDE